MTILEYIKNNHLLFDGAMGTMLQKSGFVNDEIPDLLNLNQPELIRKLHKEYVAAGCDVITTNTFGANSYKIANVKIPKLIEAAVNNAKEAKPKYIALDVGPIGQLLAPIGNLSFETAYNIFKEQVVAGEESGANLIIFETFSDLMELKLAILAAKENTSLPIFATMTYQEDGRTFLGTDPLSATITLNGLGVDAMGVNCSLGPNQLSPIIKTILEYSKVPVIVQANAGMPDINGNYKYDCSSYTDCIVEMINSGVRIVGGCCGTTPEFINKIRKKIDGMPLTAVTPKKATAVCSDSSTVILDDKITVIGEKINPTGKPELKAAIKNENYDYILAEALSQKDNGANILDINVGLPEINEANVLKTVITKLQSCLSIPLQIDSTDHKVIENAVRAYKGKPIINSVSGDEKSMADIFPIAKKYGACIIGICLDKNGIPKTAEGRFKLAEKIVSTALEYGIDKEDILIDCLALTASAEQNQIPITLKALKMVKEGLGVKCILGISNVSFGMPNRPLLNSVFLSAALASGLDAPILNPSSPEIMDVINTYKVFNGEDNEGQSFIKKYAADNIPILATKQNVATDLKDIIIKGLKDEATPILEEMLLTNSPMEIIDNYFIPALNVVGSLYETGKIFLPQLMLSAQTVQNGFNVINKYNAEAEVRHGKIIIATVEGDIHDIGKNIVKMLLSNYGYEVIDLGKNVSSKDIIKAIKAHNVSLVCLSALMTTTVKNIKSTINDIRSDGLNCKIIVGGAVLNEEYAKMVGSDYYAKDANETVQIAQKHFKSKV